MNFTDPGPRGHQHGSPKLGSPEGRGRAEKLPLPPSLSSTPCCTVAGTRLWTSRVPATLSTSSACLLTEWGGEAVGRIHVSQFPAEPSPQLLSSYPYLRVLGVGVGYELGRPRPPILPPLSVLGQRGDRYVSAHPHCPPLLYRAHMRSGSGWSISTYSATTPIASSAGSRVLTAASPLVVLLLWDDGLTEVDYCLPRSPASQHSMD